MITLKAFPKLLKIAAKLDIEPLIEPLKDMDIFAEPKSKEDVTRQLSKEKIGIIGMTILARVTPQIGKIADDIPDLVAAYKDISIEEANKLNAFEAVNELIHDDGIQKYFFDSLKKKLGLGT